MFIYNAILPLNIKLIVQIYIGYSVELLPSTKKCFLSGIIYMHFGYMINTITHLYAHPFMIFFLLAYV